MEKIWLKSYPANVTHEIDPDKFASIRDLLTVSCQRFSSQPAFENRGTTLTYQQLLKKSSQLAAYLQQQLGLQKGDRLAIMLPNLLQYPIVLFAALQLGLVVVNINPLYTAREMLIPLKDSGAKAIIVLSLFCKNLQQIRSQTALEHIIITDLGDEYPTLKRFLVNGYLKYIKKLIPKVNLLSALNYRQVMGAAMGLTLKPVAIQATDLAFLQYTGGTTGIPKGAMLTQRNIIANILQCAQWHGFLQEGRETIVECLPLYHIFALTCCLVFWHLGEVGLLITNPKDIKSFIKHLSRYPFTVFLGVNTLYLELTRHPLFKKLNFKTLKLAVAGGMAVAPPVAQSWQSITGKPILMGYGLTEASPVVTINPLEQTHFTLSAGLPLPSTEIKIIDDEGNALLLSQPGELLVRGPQVMQGYWQQPAETQAAFLSGWLRTGDIACMDEQGYIYLIDRKKDMILVSGFNVFPHEIEEVITSHPGVLEAAVIGIPSEQTGETVKAYVVLKDKQLTQHDLHLFCKQKLTGYKLPRSYEFREMLPKSNIGKILKRKLREDEVMDERISR